MREVDVLIIGGGPAGLAAAAAAFDEGCRSILILEREDSLGGILKQCIHNGFGLHTFKEELTGPEYAERFIEMTASRGIEAQCGTMVIDVTPQKVVTCVSRTQGLQQIQAKALILAMGCRERPRGSLGTPGWRCAGIYTAGTAQKLVNLHGLMPGKRVVILGSGDIGLIMARRMTFSGAKVLGCVELMPYSAGLKRNIVQCLDDYDIPLFLSHTVVDIEGRERLSGVVIAAVDDKLRPIPGTEQHFDCDTLLLSVGLIPENELTKMAGVELSAATSGAVVDDTLETSVPGVLACGNVLHVHDLVDYVSEESARAGRNAARWAAGGKNEAARIPIEAGNGANAVVPQFISAAPQQDVTLMFRPRGVYRNATVRVLGGGEVLAQKKARILAPGEMVTMKIPADYRERCPEAASLRVEVEVPQ